jgi:uncharacterized membrane protein
MSFCQTCGSSLPDGSAACPACGASQGVAASSTTPGAIPGSYPSPAPVVAPAAAAGSGLTPNVAGALAYLLGVITGVLFLVIDPFKNDRFVRFHAFQSIFVTLAWFVFWILWQIVYWTLTAISHGIFFLILAPISLLIAVAWFCLWVYLMYSAYQGKTFQVPIVGPLAAKQAGV